MGFHPTPHPQKQPPEPRAIPLRIAGSLASVCIAAGVFSLSLAPVSSAQTPGGTAQLGETYAKAMNAFGAGDFAAALAGLEEMLSSKAEGPAMESVHFSIAAAHFNLNDPKKAKAAFERYLKLYPNGGRAADAELNMAHCLALLGQKEQAAAALGALAQKGGPNKEQAVLTRASLLKEIGKTADAAQILQTLVAEGFKTQESVQAALLLGAVEAGRGERDKALKILEALQGRLLSLVDNPLQLNALAFEVGDAFLHALEMKKALAAYSMVRRKEETVILQQQRIQGIVRRMEANVAAAKADPARTVELTGVNSRLRVLLDAARLALEQATQAPDQTAALRARQASAYQEIGRLEEAILLLESVLPTADKSNREAGLFSLGSLHARAGDSAASEKILQTLLEEFPQTRNADAALLLLGTQKLQVSAFDEASEAFSKLLASHPKSPHAPTAQFVLANTLFSKGRYPEAIEGYDRYLKGWPSGEYAGEAVYRTALAKFFQGKYGAALAAFESILKNSPDGLYAPDAEYRIAACYQAARKTEEVARRCSLWEARYGDHPTAGDVLSLHGDALTALNKHEEAAALYRKASLCGSSEEVVHYALFEANKQLQRLGQSETAAQMFREFLASKPDHPSNVLAMYWIAKATARAGKLDEARTFLGEKIRDFIADRSRDAVEQLLAQLAQLSLKAQKPAPGADGAPPAEPPHDPAAVLEKHLNASGFPDTPLVAARIAYARAELARLQRKPEAAAAVMDGICDKTPPASLGAALLAQCGDRLLERNELKRAGAFYDELAKAFPKSELLDYAYNGRGQIALKQGKPDEALKWFSDAVDKAGASSKLKDVTLGRAKALLETGSLDEAKALFEQVASTREWRGESTAEAILMLGNVLLKKGDPTGAVQYFQRVFVAYQRHERFVSQAYLLAAECFEKLQEPDKAAAHYRELLAKPRLASLPEAKTARERLDSRKAATPQETK